MKNKFIKINGKRRLASQVKGYERSGNNGIKLFYRLYPKFESEIILCSSPEQQDSILSSLDEFFKD